MQKDLARNHADELRNAPVSSVMTKGVLTCPPEADIGEMARTMSQARVHCLFVDVARGQPTTEQRWAVVSDLDLVAAAAAGGGHAGQVSATPTVTVDAADSLLHAAELMRDYQTGHLVVTGSEQDPVGVISTLDIAGALSPGG